MGNLPGRNRLHLSVRKNSAVYIIDVEGELNLYTAFRLKALFLKMIDKSISRFIFNMNGLTYIDSSGLGALIFIYSSAQKQRLKTAFTNIGGITAKILDITKLMGYFPAAGSIEEAIAMVTAD